MSTAEASVPEIVPTEDVNEVEASILPEPFTAETQELRSRLEAFFHQYYSISHLKYLSACYNLRQPEDDDPLGQFMNAIPHLFIFNYYRYNKISKRLGSAYCHVLNEYFQEWKQNPTEFKVPSEEEINDRLNKNKIYAEYVTQFKRILICDEDKQDALKAVHAVQDEQQPRKESQFVHGIEKGLKTIKDILFMD